MGTAVEDAPLEMEEKFFQKFFSMAKKAAKKEQTDSREPIYLTADDYQAMGDALMKSGQKMAEVAAKEAAKLLGK